MRNAPAVLPRRDQWRGLPDANFREAVADALDQNDRDHVTLAEELKRSNTLMTQILVALGTSAILLAVNIGIQAL